MLKQLLIAGMIAALPVAALAQPPKPVTTYKAPRSADGHASLEGVWTNASLTRLERNPRYGQGGVLTAEEVAKAEGANDRVLALAAKPTDPNATVLDLPADCSGGRVTNCNYNAQWTDPGEKIMRVAGQPRNGFITTPADGRVPMKSGGGAGRNFGGRLPPGVSQNDNPEGRSLGERCLLSFGNSSGPVMLPSLYNNTYQIVQTKDHVSIVVEMVHDTRIVRMNTRQHDPVRKWMGDSIGWWEGDTLVIETTNYHPAQNFRGSSANLKVTERLTPVGAGRLHYSFWVEDSTVFAQPWGGEYEFSRLKDHQIYEYACHEGNYGLANILSGARHEERTGVKSAPTNVDQRAAQSQGDEGDEGGN